MNRADFIPGLWEEEANVEDFININGKEYDEGDFVIKEHDLKIEKGYDILKDEDKKFSYIGPFEYGKYDSKDVKKKIFINEEVYTKYTESGDRKKLRDSRLLVKANESERTSFFQPDISLIPLYGTRAIINNLKQYIKDMDKQFKSVDWIQRRINHFRSLESLVKFEEFAKEHRVAVKKPATNSIEVAQSLWITTLYAVYEDADIPFSLYSIFDLLDIYLEYDLRKGNFDESTAQKIVDELYAKLASLSELSDIVVPFDFNLTIRSNKIYKTTYRFIEAARAFGDNQIPIQLIFNEKEFPKDLMTEFNSLFNEGHRFAVSQSFRKKSDTSLTLTSSHTFFRNYEDVTIQLASFDLKKAFLIALNGGKDIETNTNFYQISQRVNSSKLSYEEVMTKFEAYLKYYITLYSEYMNVYTYYYDQYHRLPFRQSLTTEYPHYLMNMAYHNVTPLIKVLTAIKKKEYKLLTDKKGYIEDVIPNDESEDSVIAEHLNKIINNETEKILFYKNGNYNIVFFSEKSFFQNEDGYKLSTFEPGAFERTSFSGFKSLTGDQFLEFLGFFPESTYSHIRLHKI